MVDAGTGASKYSRRTRWMVSKCSMLRTYTSTRQMSLSDPPAASQAAFRFSQTCRVCASMSPTPAMCRRPCVPSCPK